MDLQNPTDQEDYCVHSDEDTDFLSQSSSLSCIASPAIPTLPVTPVSPEEDYHMNSDNDTDPPSPTLPPPSFVPFPLENALGEDFGTWTWIVVMLLIVTIILQCFKVLCSKSSTD